MTKLGYLEKDKPVENITCTYLPESKSIECALLDGKSFKIENVGKIEKTPVTGTPPHLAFENYVGDIITELPKKDGSGSGKRTVFCAGECIKKSGSGTTEPLDLPKKMGTCICGDNACRTEIDLSENNDCKIICKETFGYDTGNGPMVGSWMYLGAPTETCKKKN